MIFKNQYNDGEGNKFENRVMLDKIEQKNNNIKIAFLSAGIIDLLYKTQTHTHTQNVLVNSLSK